MMVGIGLPELLVICFVMVFVLLLIVLPYWKIFGKAGFSSWFGILMVIPIVNIGMLFFLAFAEWPSLKQQKPEDPYNNPRN
jgi:hypothetical protein